MLLPMGRLPAAPSRPSIHPQVSPAPPSLRPVRRQQHGRVAMARTTSTTPVVCRSCLVGSYRTANSNSGFGPRSRSIDRDRGSPVSRANPAATLRAAVKVRRSNGRRFRCNVIRSNLFDRLTRVVRSYGNAVLSSFEDPEKILDQAVLEMNDDLIKMRQATAQVLASQKRLENKYKAAEQADADWYRRAQLALQKGDEELAREALKRRKSYADNASSLKAQLDQQKGVVENLVSITKLLESKIAEAKQKKDTLKARAQSAKTATKVSEMLGNVNTSSALSAFEKMEEKVMTMESQAEALGQLGADDLEGKFAMLETTSVDDDLAQMRKELSGSSLKGELPAGRTTISNSGSPSRDTEIENELNELRKKAKEY